MNFARLVHLLPSWVRLAAWFGGFFASAVIVAAADASANENLVAEYVQTTKPIGVSVVSVSPDIAHVMQLAFSLHGAFDPAASTASVKYVLRFTPAGTNGMTVTVEPKTPGGVSFQAQATGGNLTEAAYRAGDAVVEKLTQRPGFFAGKLAFASTRTKYREIYTSDVLGRFPVQLTADRSVSANPRWSPDGTKLLYTGYYRSGFPDIILYNLTTKTRSAFAAYEGTNTGGTFSPDGKSVAMILSSKEGSTELYVSDAEGKNVRRLTHATSSKSSPTWSPDSKQIMLSCDPQGAPLLYEIPAAGGSLKLVQNKVYAYSAEAVWNPLDQNSIAFMQQMTNGTMQILTYDFKNPVKVLTEGSEPCWANDGRHIIYTKHVKGVDQLYIVDSVTKKDMPLPIMAASDPAFVYVK